MVASALLITIEALNKATAPIKAVQDQIDALQKSSRAIREVGDGITGIGALMTATVTAPIVAGLGAASHAAIAFESSLAGVNKAFGVQAGTEQAAELSNQILNMTRTLPYAATEIAEIASSAGMLGVQRDQMEPFVSLVSQMGTAFDMSAAQAGDSIAKLSNIFGYMDGQGRVNIEGLSTLGDTINYLADSGATSAVDITNAMTRVGGAARNFGLANDETAALTTAFLNLGRPPEVVATALSSMLPALQNATGGTEKFQNGLERLGISATQMESMIGKDASGAVETFFQSLSKLDAATRTKAIAEMFGSGSDSQIIAQLASDTTQLTKSFDALSNIPTGGMLGEFENKAATTANQLQLLQNNIQVAAINIGSALLPAINDIVTALTPAIQGFADFAAANPEIIKMGAAIGLVVAAAGPLLIVLGQVINAIATIHTAMAALKTLQLAVAFSGATTALGSFLMMAGGLLAIPLAVIAIGEALTGVDVTFADIGATIAASFASLPANLAIIPEAIGGMFTAAVAIAKLRFFELVNFFGSIADGMVNRATAAATGIANAFRNGGQQAVQAIANMGNSMVQLVSGLGSRMFQAGAALIQRLASGISSGIGAVSNAISGVTRTIASFLPGSPVDAGVLRSFNSLSSNPGFELMNRLAAGLGAANLTPVMNTALSPIATAASGQAGGMAIAPTASPGSGMMGGQFIFSPNLTVNPGNGDGVRIGKEIIDQLEPAFMEFMSRMQRHQQRVAY